jgi:hypothetical protein
MSLEIGDLVKDKIFARKGNIYYGVVIPTGISQQLDFPKSAKDEWYTVHWFKVNSKTFQHISTLEKVP